MLTAAIALCATTAAFGAVDQESIFMDDDMLLYGGDERTDKTLGELRDLGVDRVRVSLHWRSMVGRKRDAAVDTAVYDKFDHLVRVARKLDMRVLFNVTGGAPGWATGRIQGAYVNAQYRPDAAAFGAWVERLGRRYDGDTKDENQGQTVLPRVDAWSIWNEPNQGAFLQPQWVRHGRRWVPASPRIYRSLARAGIAGLRATGHEHDTILIGETAPLGSKRRGRPRAMAPGVFVARLFCLVPRTLKRSSEDCAKLDGASGFAHHPYSVTAAPSRSRRNRDEIVLADRARLYRILDAASPKGLPVWFTEYGYQTRPPDPFRGIGPELAARYLTEAERLTREDGRVAALTQFLLQDDEPRTQFGARDKRRWITYQSGLRYDDGAPKPSLAAYRLPLVAPARVPPGRALDLWGFVRPAPAGQPTRVQLEVAPEGSADYEPVGDPLDVDGSGVFRASVEQPRSGTWRFTWTPPAPAGQPSFFDALSGAPGPGSPAPVASAPVPVRVG
jgi:hypothetical protein